ncbi:hypothetical protein [Paraliomyxa miuraensis]|uniref:hypothetical protein n=1 Tax=Paraliomyxa miuraensis TaxID=376150 RepID=UPI00225304B4|nr:hypothetical protein [Paraliomyxa miuraensis]MCX4242235.1 hypothetical protein [Paraliomyxa miuraensis]
MHASIELLGRVLASAFVVGGALASAGCPDDDPQVTSQGDSGSTGSTGGPAMTQGTSASSSSGDPDATASETAPPTSGTTEGETTSGTADGGMTEGSSEDTSGDTGPGIMDQGYGDCLNEAPMDVCLMGEECINDAGMPPGVGVCAYQGCAGPGSCPQPPPGGTATSTCMDVTGDLVDECVLACGGGASCPTGMVCFSEFLCVWGVGMGPGDFTCADANIGASTGAAVASGSTVGMGNDFQPGCVGPNGQDVALVWTALVSGTYTFDTVGSDYDTILYVRKTCKGAELACNDDTVMLQSEVTLDIMAGRSVLVVIDGYGNSSGNYVLNVSAS